MQLILPQAGGFRHLNVRLNPFPLLSLPQLLYEVRLHNGSLLPVPFYIPAALNKAKTIPLYC